MSAGGQGQMLNPAMRGGYPGANPAMRGGFPQQGMPNPAMRGPGMGYPGTPNPAMRGPQPSPAMQGGMPNPAARGVGMPGMSGSGGDAFNPAMRGSPAMLPGMQQMSPMNPAMSGLNGVLAALNNPAMRGGPMSKPMADSGIQAPSNPVLLNPTAPPMQQRNITQDQPWQTGQRTGTWLDDYLNPMGDGFTGTRNYHNYINGHPFAPEFNAQMAATPNTPSFAFGNALNTYGDRMRQLGILR